LHQGHEAFGLLVFATIGNALGSMTSYYLGLVGNWLILEKHFKIQRDKVEKWLDKVKRHEKLFAFMSWLPVVGDFFPAALGASKSNVFNVIVWITIGKFLRYGFLYAGFKQLF